MKDILIGTILSPKAAMDLAIDLAYQGSNRVSPNPHVGCVVLDKSYKLLSYGYHEYFGGPHAEVNALKNVSTAALEGAHVFVSLEPCSHHGKTPPCADFLATLPIESLTYGLEDPNPQVAGKGLDLLRRRGIRIHTFDRNTEALEDLLLTFKYHLKSKEAFIALKVATSLDGAIADFKQQSQWITSEDSRKYVHQLRSRYQAMLVGKNTVLQDDPLLTVRDEQFAEHKNRVIILNPNLNLLPVIAEKKIYKARKPQDIILVAGEAHVKSLEPMKDHIYRDPQSGVLVIAIENTEAGLNLRQLKILLPQLQIYDVMVEGGASTFSSFLEQDAFDHIYLFQAPILLGAEKSKLWTAHLSKTLENKIRLHIISTKKLGGDILLQLTKQ